MNWNWLKKLVQKAITTGIVATGAALASGIPIENGWILGAIFAYAVWTDVIVPGVNGWLKSGMRTEAGPVQTGWKLF